MSRDTEDESTLPASDDESGSWDARIGPYRLASVLASGGGGLVYRGKAPDGTRVAVKVLDNRVRNETARQRFEREASIRIEHPNVIKILDAGIDAGSPWIAMELLEGRTLTARLEEGPLPPAEAVEVALQICRGLEAAHARGVVHRDLKPDNVFLCSDGTVKVLDFGIALAGDDRTRMTTTGMVLGTPYYLAPEQARGDRELDQRVDVWGVGAVMYQMLTGRTPFERDGVIATVVAILREELEPIRRVKPQVAPSLAYVVERCLVKDREYRWPSVTALSAALSEVDPNLLDHITAEMVMPRASIPPGEQRLVAVILAVGASDPGQIEEAIVDHGGVYLPLVGKRAVGLFGAESWEGDELERAALAALDCEGAAQRIAVAAGRAMSQGSGISGAALKAVEESVKAPIGGVAIDARSAKGLFGKFEVLPHDGGVYQLVDRKPGTPLPPAPASGLVAIVPAGDSIPPGATLQSTRMIGREAEIAQMSTALRAAVEEERAVAVLMTGPAGIGKSRLRREMEGILARNAEMEVVAARADPLGRTAALSLLKASLRRHARIGALDRDWPRMDADAPEEERRAAVVALTRDAIADEALAGETAPFLGELLGVPMEATTELEAARSDPQLMSDRLRLAIRDWFAGLCARAPVTLMVEDVQWSDPSSLDVLEELLDRLADQRFFLFATAQPWLFESRPRFLEGFEVVKIELRGLGLREVAGLARATAGRPVSDELVRTLTDHTAGNPLFIEQIVGELAEQGALDAPPKELPLPVTVEAAVQSRLDHLPPYEKDLCKRAAILGRPFSSDEVEALGSTGARALLDSLRKRGIIAARAASRVGSAREYRFRSALISDVAYNMLADDLRADLHRRAAAMLANDIEIELEELAIHHERGGETVKAAARYVSATLEAAKKGDSETVLRCSDKALALGAPHKARFELHMARAEALRFGGRFSEQRKELESALELSGTATQRAKALSAQMSCEWELRNRQGALQAAQAAIAAAAEAGDPDLQALALARLAMLHAVAGDLSNAHAVLSEATPLMPSASKRTKATAAAAGARLAAAQGDHGAALDAYGTAKELFRAAGDLRRAAISEMNLADTYNRVGGYAEAADALYKLLDTLQRLHSRTTEAYARMNLGYAEGMRGRPHEAREHLETARRIALSIGSESLLLQIDVHLCRVALASQTHDVRYRSQELAAQAETAGMMSDAAEALTIAARACLNSGDVAQALSLSARALTLRDRIGALNVDEGEVFLARIEALEQVGDVDEARKVTRAAIARIGAQAAKIRDNVWRARFETEIRAHRLIRERAAGPITS